MNKTIEEKKTIDSQLKSCGIDEKICDARCSICNSGYLPEIHKLRKNGKTFDEIVIACSEQFGYSVSPASLCRHFKNYADYKRNVATKIIKNETLEEITSQSVHLQKTVQLLDLAYDKILNAMNTNSYKIDISDLEKLAKIRYQILQGDNLDNKDVLAVFQKATDKYGLQMNEQAVLFKT